MAPQLLIAVIALIASLVFNWLQYKWRREDRAQRDRDKADSKAEQQRKEEAPPEFYNFGGSPGPIVVSGSQHSVRGPMTDLWAVITVVNHTQLPMKIELLRVVLEGEVWPVNKFTFHSKSNDLERFQRISLVGNAKQDYQLHFLFDDDKCPRSKAGELHLSSSNRKEPFSVPIRFS